MKKYLSAIIVIISSLAITPTFAIKKITPNIRIATYNITHGKKNNWKKRQLGVCNTITSIGADILGLQEVIKGNKQFTTIKKTLSGYDHIGSPRSKGMKGLSLKHRIVMMFAQDEYSPIFYNKNTFELISSATFGINGKGSAPLPRICTVGCFRHKATKKDFFVYNTHLDNKEEKWRIMQINIILDDVAIRCGDTPAIIMGDFNTPFAGNIQTSLENAGFEYAKNIALKKENADIGTHEKSKGKNKYIIDCDLIAIKGKDITVNLFKIFNTMDKLTSDHNPVCVDVSFKK